ncbi:MAG: ABC transporter permease [Defluviitaleaceae bacterium]|nr:ABC transporter permease [Defluviitaleaceae bacterium]
MNILKLVAKNLFRRKGRFIFTMLGISIGMASFVALLSLGGSMRGEVTRQANAMGANFIIMPENICVFNLIAIITGETISESMHHETFERISELEGIEVIPHLTQQAAVRELRSVVVGVLPDETKIFREWKMAAGEYFSSQNENAAIIGSDFATRRDLNVGDEITIRNENFNIKGILASNQSNDDATLFLPLSVMQRVFEREGYISYISARVDDIANMESYEAAILGVANVHIATDEQLLGQVLAILGSVNITLQLVAAVALIAAAFGIINTMMTAVYERRREIGIMRAIGGKRGTIFKIFLLESGLYGLFGGISGVVIGLFASVFAGEFISQIGANDLLKGASPEASFEISSVLTAITFSLVISIISGIYPAWKAMLLAPVEAISYE